MNQLNQILSVCFIINCLVWSGGCDSNSELASSQNLKNMPASSAEFQVPSLAFGKSDQTQSAELKETLKLTHSYPDVAEKAHVFPIQLQKGDRIKVYTWTDQLAMVLMFESETQE